MQKATLNRFVVKKKENKEKEQYGGQEKPKEMFKGQY